MMCVIESWRAWRELPGAPHGGVNANMSENSSSPQFTVGLFGIGLDAYWPQFAGLQKRLTGYIQQVAQRLQRPGVRVINLGLVDSPEKAQDAGHAFRRHDVDLIFLYVTTYALSSTVLPVVRRARIPVILLNLSPSAAIDYKSFNQMGDRTKMTGEWLAYCQACPVPEIASVFRRCHIPFFQVTGMLDIYSDLTQQCAYFGGHIEMLEVDELTDLRRKVSGEEISGRVQVFRDSFDVQPDCPPVELERAARTSVALDRLVEVHKLGSLAYYFKGVENSENEDTISSIILGTSLLTARGTPVAGEYEIKNAQAMKIMDCFGVGGSFTEYYAVDFNDDVILMGHDGPGHIAIAQGKTKVRPLSVYHGKVGRGLSVEMSVKHGPVTLLSVVQTGDGKLKLLVAESISEPGPILEIGNTNSRYRFSMGARNFMNAWNAEGPAHHCAIGIGHISSKLSKLGQLLGME